METNVTARLEILDTTSELASSNGALYKQAWASATQARSCLHKAEAVSSVGPPDVGLPLPAAPIAMRPPCIR
jgi:hypothetical protein